jgi:transcription antitermination factor NusG
MTALKKITSGLTVLAITCSFFATSLAAPINFAEAHHTAIHSEGAPEITSHYPVIEVVNNPVNPVLEVGKSAVSVCSTASYNTNFLQGFFGSGVYPVPVDKKEIDFLFSRMNSSTAKHSIDLSINDAVIIVDGPFKDLEGKVSNVDEQRGKVKILVSMFGRETPVELDFLQVKRI